MASRVLALLRSPVYAQRNVPTTLVGAVQVLGSRMLKNVVFASATLRLCLIDIKTAELICNHSLAIALTMQLHGRSFRCRDARRAFLAGLMHDVGEMTLVHSDPRGFEQFGKEVNRSFVE